MRENSGEICAAVPIFCCPPITGNIACVRQLERVVYLCITFWMRSLFRQKTTYLKNINVFIFLGQHVQEGWMFRVQDFKAIGFVTSHSSVFSGD